MKSNLYIVTVVDYSDTCDGKARTLGVCLDMEDAQAVVYGDIEHWVDERAGSEAKCDFQKMRAWTDDEQCEWNIECVENPLAFAAND